LENINQILEFKTEFPDTQILRTTVLNRVLDGIYEKFGFEEEDYYSFNTTLMSGENQNKIRGFGTEMMNVQRRIEEALTRGLAR